MRAESIFLRDAGATAYVLGDGIAKGSCWPALHAHDVSSQTDPLWIGLGEVLTIGMTDVPLANAAGDRLVRTNGSWGLTVSEWQSRGALPTSSPSP